MDREEGGNMSEAFSEEELRGYLVVLVDHTCFLSLFQSSSFGNLPHRTDPPRTSWEYINVANGYNTGIKKHVSGIRTLALEHMACTDPPGL
jgi:hypothetical protein